MRVAVSARALLVVTSAQALRRRFFWLTIEIEGWRREKDDHHVVWHNYYVGHRLRSCQQLTVNSMKSSWKGVVWLKLKRISLCSIVCQIVVLCCWCCSFLSIRIISSPWTQTLNEFREWLWPLQLHKTIMYREIYFWNLFNNNEALQQTKIRNWKTNVWSTEITYNTSGGVDNAHRRLEWSHSNGHQPGIN